VGIRTADDVQMVILDTPGLLEPKHALHRSMRGAALDALREADVIVYLIDVAHDMVAPLAEVAGLEHAPRAPVLLALNKSDLLKGMKKNDTIAFLKVRQFARTRNGIMIAANDRASLHPLLDELQHRFWAEGMEPLID
jgi:GTPase Era involved in 16S rRNA processing